MVRDEIYKTENESEVTMDDLTKKMKEAVKKAGMHEVMEKLSECCGEMEDES